MSLVSQGRGPGLPARLITQGLVSAPVYGSLVTQGRGLPNALVTQGFRGLAVAASPVNDLVTISVVDGSRYQRTLVGVQPGAAFGVARTYTDLPSGTLLLAATMRVKRASDGAAVLTKSIDQTWSFLQGGVVQPGAAVGTDWRAELRFVFGAAETAGLRAGVVYQYFVNVTSAQGNSFLTESGVWPVL